MIDYKKVHGFPFSGKEDILGRIGEFEKTVVAEPLKEPVPLKIVEPEEEPQEVSP